MHIHSMKTLRSWEHFHPSGWLWCFDLSYLHLETHWPICLTHYYDQVSNPYKVSWSSHLTLWHRSSIYNCSRLLEFFRWSKCILTEWYQSKNPWFRYCIKPNSTHQGCSPSFQLLSYVPDQCYHSVCFIRVECQPLHHHPIFSHCWFEHRWFHLQCHPKLVPLS